MLLVWPLCALLLAGRAVALSSICPLSWNENKSLPDGIDLSIECPYGKKFPVPKFDTTIPNNPTIIDWICVVYGALPFLIIFFSVLHTLRNACRMRCFGTRELSFMGFVLVSVGLNELIFKKLAKLPRPELSCNTTCGFPSGHSTMAIGFFTLMFCDAVFRVRPKLPTDLDHAQMEGAFRQSHEHTSRWSLIWKEGKVMIHVIPLSRADILGPADFLSYVLTWGILLIPVPFSRVVLNDHTALQVMVGSFVGIVEAICWFGFVRHSVQMKYNDRLGSLFCHGLIMHNHALPRFDVHAKCCRMLARMINQAQSRDVSQTFASQDNVVLLQHLERMRSEIQWYLDQDKHRMMPYLEDKIYTLIEDTNLLKLRHYVDEAIACGGDAECLLDTGGDYTARGHETMNLSARGGDYSDSSHGTMNLSSRGSPRRSLPVVTKNAKTSPAHWRTDGGRRGITGANQLFK